VTVGAVGAVEERTLLSEMEELESLLPGILVEYGVMKEAKLSKLTQNHADHHRRQQQLQQEQGRDELTADGTSATGAGGVEVGVGIGVGAGAEGATDEHAVGSGGRDDSARGVDGGVNRNVELPVVPQLCACEEELDTVTYMLQKSSNFQLVPHPHP